MTRYTRLALFDDGEMMRQLHHCQFCKSFRYYPEYSEGYDLGYGSIECERRPSDEVSEAMPVINCGWFAPRTEADRQADIEWIRVNS